MVTNTAKRKENIEKVKAVMKGNERILSEDNYMRDLMHSLNYYNANNNDADKKKWFISHYAKIDKKLAVELLKVDEYHFRYAGTLTRLIDIGSTLQTKEQNFLNERIEFLKSQVAVRQKSQDKIDKTLAEIARNNLPENVISIQERMENKAHEYAGEIEGAIDDFILNECKSEFSTKNYLLANQVSGPVAKRIGELFNKLSEELKEVISGKDSELAEGYSNFNKRELKRFSEFVDGIISDCNQMVQTAKANRTPRKTKPASPIKVVSKMKYMKEFAELNLKSILPTGIIGSSEVWFYNTKYRRIGVYKAEGTTLSVKGTTIVGFDIKESKSFTLRKPDEFFKGLSMGKRALNSAMKSLTTKPAVPNGRINEECIILGAF
jgi:hypothetical protein